RVLGGEEAERWGFFNRLASPDTVLVQAQQLAAELAAGPTFANAMTKRMLDMEWAMSVESAIEAEAVAQALCMETLDFARASRARDFGVPGRIVRLRLRHARPGLRLDLAVRLGGAQGALSAAGPRRPRHRCLRTVGAGSGVRRRRARRDGETRRGLAPAHRRQ